MSNTRPPHPAQPARELARRHALAWADAAAARSGSGILFVDAFAGHDYPAGPPLGLEVAARLEAAAGEPRPRVRLAEVDPVKLGWLRERAEVGGGAGVGFEWVESEAAALRAPRGDAGETLALFDPPSGAALPLQVLASWAALPGAEVLVSFPARDLRRLAARWAGTLADLTPYDRRVVDGLSRLLGDPRHAWVLEWRSRSEAEGSAAAERGVVQRLAERLRSEAWVRVLEVGEGDAAGFVLAASRDPGRLLRVSGTLHAMRVDGALAWPADGRLVRHAEGQSISLFGTGPAPRERIVDEAGLAHRLAGCFSGRAVTLDEVLASVLETELRTEEVRRALRALRRDGRVLYRSLASGDSQLTFAEPGARPRARSTAGRRRGRRGPELSLALGED